MEISVLVRMEGGTGVMVGDVMVLVGLVVDVVGSDVILAIGDVVDMVVVV